MLTPDQLAAIKVKLTKGSHGIPVYACSPDAPGDIQALINEVERLTRHNQRMSQALAQLSDGENWEYYDGWHWTGVGTAGDGPQQLAEHALVEDG